MRPRQRCQRGVVRFRPRAPLDEALARSRGASGPAAAPGAAGDGYCTAGDAGPTPADVRKAAYAEAKQKDAQVISLRRKGVAGGGAVDRAASGTGDYERGAAVAPAAAPEGTDGGSSRRDALANYDAQVQQGVARLTGGGVDPSGGDGGSGRSLRAGGPMVATPRNVPPGTLRAGTLIDAQLVTAINTDRPGVALAQVSRPVWDSSGRCVVIPQGAMLVGEVDDQVAIGQQRGAVAWTEVQVSRQQTIDLPGLPTVDRAGAPGIAAEVDNHYGRVFGQAVLLSALGAGVQLGQPASGGAYPSSQQQAAGAVSTELGRVASEQMQKRGGIRPTLQVPANSAIRVLVNRDYFVGGPRC